MSLYEYEMKMQAFNLSQVDKQHEMHMQAWLNHQVTATKESGKKQVPVFKKYEDFFNYEKSLKQVEKPKQKSISPRMKRMARIAAKLNREGR
ncbi:hypothetical protein ACFSMW_06590 [Virgibacillus halophilus]